MAKLKLIPETFNIDDGTYEGIITNVIIFDEEKVLLKIKLSESEIYMNSTTLEKLVKYPFSKLFLEINSDDTNDLVGKKVKFEIKNRTTEKGITFSNIKKINLVD